MGDLKGCDILPSHSLNNLACPSTIALQRVQAPCHKTRQGGNSETSEEPITPEVELTECRSQSAIAKICWVVIQPWMPLLQLCLYMKG